MIISGTLDEVVVVGAYNTADRTNEYTYLYDPSESSRGKVGQESLKTRKQFLSSLDTWFL